MTLTNALEGKEYIIQKINTDDEELDAFLFSLGCYAGEPITVVSSCASFAEYSTIILLYELILSYTKFNTKSTGV